MNPPSQSWADLKNIILTNLNDIMIPYDDMPSDIPDWLGKSSLSLNTKADGCVEFFVKYRRWQGVEGELRTMLFLRSIFAAEAFLSRESRAYPHPEYGTEQTYVEHMLSSGWYHEWHGWAHLHFSGSWDLPFNPWELN